MQITALLSGLDVENNLSVIQSAEMVAKLEFKTHPSPALGPRSCSGQNLPAKELP